MEGRIPAGANGTLILVLLSFMLGGCATHQVKLYPGPALPEQQIATVQTDMTVVIKAVDGEAMGEGLADVELQLLPGRHRVQFGFTHETCFNLEFMQDRQCRRFDFGDFLVTFEAKAGHHYRIAVNSWMAGWQPYLIDKSDGDRSSEAGKGSFFLGQEVSGRPTGMPDAKPSTLPPSHD